MKEPPCQCISSEDAVNRACGVSTVVEVVYYVDYFSENGLVEKKKIIALNFCPQCGKEYKKE